MATSEQFRQLKESLATVKGQVGLLQAELVATKAYAARTIAAANAAAVAAHAGATTGPATRAASTKVQLVRSGTFAL
jgi:hypothetical protein